jgi:hypothetical protein
MCFNVTVSILALAGAFAGALAALAGAAAFAIVIPLMRNRIAFRSNTTSTKPKNTLFPGIFRMRSAKKAAFVARKQARHNA